MMKTAAIIGCGKANTPGQKIGWGIAHMHAAGYRAAFPDVTLYAVDINPDNLRSFAELHGIPSQRCFTSTEALYATHVPDMVSICTWPPLHAPQTIEAIQADVRAIVCEKPLAVSGLEIEQIRQAIQRSRARVAVAHQRRYLPAYTLTRQLMADGVLGDRLVVEGRVDDEWDMLSWTVHWFDLANYLLDARPQWVLAGLEDAGERRYGHAVERMSVAVADYGEKGQGVFVTGPAAYPAFGLSVQGEKGMIRIGGGTAPIQVWTREGYREESAPPMPPGLPEDAFGAVFADLWQAAITDGPPTRCEFIHTALATQMAFACHESARIRQRVALPLKTQYAPLELGHHPPDTGAWEGAILLIADMHHVDANTGLSARDGLLAALSGLGHRVRWFDPTERDPEQSDFDGIDLLMLYHTQRTASEATRTLLGDWFQSGKPVVVSHCGIGAYDDWEAYRRWIGLYWVWGDDRTAPAGIRPSDHPHLPSTITVTAPRFAVPWRSAWIPADEVYHNLGQMAEVEILATADCGQDAQPAAWQVVNHRNVVGWLPGHRPDIWDLPVVREGLQAAIGLAIQSSVPASK